MEIKHLSSKNEQKCPTFTVKYKLSTKDTKVLLEVQCHFSTDGMSTVFVLLLAKENTWNNLNMPGDWTRIGQYGGNGRGQGGL